MPITLAHPAAVLLLRRLGMSMAALTAGSMIPDVPLFMGWWHGYALSHSAAGVLSVDLFGALVLLYGWNVLVRDALVDLAPAAVRGRLSPRHRLSRRQWLTAPAAIVLGSVTHVCWDAFTHPGRWGVLHVPWLREDLGPLPAFTWLQYVSGVLGLAVVIGAVFLELRSRPAIRPRDRRVLPAPLLPLVACAAAVYGLLAGLARLDDGLHAVAFGGVVHGTIAAVAGLSAISLVWLLRTDSAPAPPERTGA